MRRTLLSSLLLAVVLGAAAIPTHTSAAVKDDAPCSPTFEHNGLTVQICPLWRGDAPVYDFANSQLGSQVGKLNVGGTANWFVCQTQFTNIPYEYGGYENNWWAYTMADNGHWGWVPEVFFSGGGNNQADAELEYCFLG